MKRDNNPPFHPTLEEGKKNAPRIRWKKMIVMDDNHFHPPCLGDIPHAPTLNALTFFFPPLAFHNHCQAQYFEGFFNIGKFLPFFLD
jgi:hypothetical protein